MEQFVLTPEVLAGIAGVLLMLAFNYIPKLNVTFAALEPEIKRSIMGGLLLVVCVIIYVGQCYGALWSAGLTCDKAGILHLAWIYVVAVMANQGTFSIAPRTEAVKVAAQDAKFKEMEKLGLI
jgi:hypothetical protein